jgi:hypothetical protein
MSDSVEGGPSPKPSGERPPGGERPGFDDPDTRAPVPEAKGGAGRYWLIGGLVVVGLVAAVLVGYVIGVNGRDDDVKSAEAQAAQANKAAAESKQALEEDQAQDKQAVEGISQGLEDLGNAIQQEDAKDDQAAQDAVDKASNDIQSGLGQLGANASENVDKALADLSGKINEAVGSQSAENAQGTGGQ